MQCLGMLVICLPTWAQDNPIHLSPHQYEQLERLSTRYPGERNPFPGFHRMSRKEIADFLIHLPIQSLSTQDLNAVEYLVNEVPEWLTDTAFQAEYSQLSRSGNSLLRPQRQDAWLNTFYPYPGQMIFVRKNDFFLAVNPILHWKYGRQRDGYTNIFENRKGIKLRMGIDSKIFIDTKIEDLQFSRPLHITQYTNAHGSTPGFTFYTNASLFNLRGLDVLNGEANLTVPIGKYAFTRFGYGREFIGNGIQSLLLSDFGGNYLHLDFNLQIWKLRYRYMIAEVSAKSAKQLPGDQLLPKKFVATHLLQFKLWDQAHLGLFESVVFNRENQLEWHYLMPVIFFRTVERAIGSPDNILLGLDFKTTLFQRINIYSQFILDEFKSSELFGGKHWWANKWGFQLGATVYDLIGISNLNGTLEYNTVRPYTYSHRDSLAVYTHYNSPLAHPLGANFREYIGRLDYAPHRQWRIFGLLYHHQQGLNQDNINYGSDIRLKNSSRPMDYGIRTLQGRKVSVLGFQGGISYMVWHGAFLDLNLGIRREEQNNNVWGSVAFRLNTAQTGMSIF